ncbi:MAG: chemotaxis protein [Helicobacteraceae bacterium]|jgi:chemotaxis regulatin CheY-phosphate phosphatase CheZ|nr:chemotaxis protein [Helicobacteraceae bacterium]
MTQEELDALMNADMDGAVGEAGGSDSTYSCSPNNFRIQTEAEWPPPPPVKEHKVVRQLDDVAREGEEKSSQIFDILEKISNDATNSETAINNIATKIAASLEVFTRLKERFPNIKTFEAQLAAHNDILRDCDVLRQSAQNTSDQMVVAMDVMQYQDIHRQKIERVINVMRALSRYMNSLFDSKVADEKRVSSAVHIAGDSEDVVDEEGIEALIAAFGGKR